MSTETTNYNLVKPEYSDYADIEVLNENFDTIDEAMHDNAVEASLDAATKSVLESIGWTAPELQFLSSAVKFFGQKFGADPSTLKTDSKTIISAINEICNNVIADGAGAHNAIYRGKSLGSSVTAAQWAAISSGKFTDLFIGDYWTINGVNWRIAHFDYWYNTGDTACTTHHVVIVPDGNLSSGQMNSTNITTGAYIGSDFYTGNNGNTARATAQSKVRTAFGSAHILSHREYLMNAVTNGFESGQAVYDVEIELMNELMVYGSNIFHNIVNGTSIPSNYTMSKTQLALFKFRPDLIGNRSDWWLRDVVSSAYFADVGSYGYAYYGSASSAYGIRPAFAIKA